MQNKSVQKAKAQLVIVTGFLALGLLFNNEILLYAAISLGVVFLTIPVAGEVILALWFKLAEALGWINSRILLSLIFYLVLYPISIFYRISGKDPLIHDGRDLTTTYTDRGHEYKKEDLEKPW